MGVKLFRWMKPFLSGLTRKNSFTRNLFLSFSGNAVSMVLGFCLTPFIANVYGPEVYGVFALFIALITTLAPVSTMQFPSGYVAASSTREFHHLIAITVGSIFFGTILLTGIVLFFSIELLEAFDSREILPFVFFIPIQYFFMGMDNLLTGWNIYNKEFGRGAQAKIFSVLGSKGFTLAWGIGVIPNVAGMIIGNLLVYPFESIIKTSRAIRKEIPLILKNIDLRYLIDVLKKYRSYPMYVLTGSLISNIGNQLPVYLFAIYFDSTLVGMFALANSLVLMPLSIITNSSTTVFLQKAAELTKTNREELGPFIGKLYDKLIVVAAIPLVILAITGEWILNFILGQEWAGAGFFASFIAISSILGVVFFPLSVLFRILEKEAVNFRLNVIFIFVKLAGLYVGVYFQNIVFSLIGYCLATILYYAISLRFIFSMAEIKLFRVYRDLTLILICFVILIWMKGVNL